MKDLNIPNSWAKSKINDIFYVNPRNFIQNDKLEVSFVPMGYVNQYDSTIDLQKTRIWGEVKKGYTPFQDGDIVFAKITPCMENKKSFLAKNLKNSFGSASTEFHVLRPTAHTLGQFILHFIRADFFVMEATKNMKGTAGQKRVPKDWICLQYFPIPPLKEQERIVKK